MNSGIEKLVRNVGPGFATVVLVVGGFLWHLERRETAIEQMAARCHAVSERAVEALEKCAEAFGRNAVIQEQVRQVLERINGR